jgi:hypothetical protein
MEGFFAARFPSKSDDPGLTPLAQPESRLQVPLRTLRFLRFKILETAKDAKVAKKISG